MPNCYNRSILHLNLDQLDFLVEHPDDAFYRKYGGGSGMGMYYVLREARPGTDPLSPGNVLTLFTGVPTGLPISGLSRLSANARSPLGGAIGDSQSGGFFPAALKFAGFDGVVVRGKANKPVYVYIENGNVQLRDASHLWGKTTAEVDAILKQEIGSDKIEILQTGPAGENLVRFAAIMNMSNRANGRTGMGAVMGSKRLKAIVVQGSQKMQAADPKTLQRMNRSGTAGIQANLDMYDLQVNGTAGVVPNQNVTGTLPGYNYNEGQFKAWEQVSGEHMTDTILAGRDTCYACTVRCKRVVGTEFNGRPVDPVYGGPEYETIATLGTYCGIDDLNAIALGNQLCNAYGMDTISAGATIAWAMECFENGLITAQDTGGIELRFGSAEAMIAMLEAIALRTGFGDVLADGSAMAAERTGGNARDYLITVKGVEAPAHMPQAKKSLGLIYAVNPFGADHQSSEHDPAYETGGSQLNFNRLKQIGLVNVQPPGTMNVEKVRFTYLTECLFSALDSYNLCQFVYGPSFMMYGPAEIVAMLQAATGWDITLDEVMKVGERRLNMLRAFNAREGIDREADRLPKKFYKALQGSGPTAGVGLNEAELEHYKEVYYGLAGWDVQTGIPTREKLDSLGLGWIEM